MQITFTRRVERRGSASTVVTAGSNAMYALEDSAGEISQSFLREWRFLNQQTMMTINTTRQSTPSIATIIIHHSNPAGGRKTRPDGSVTLSTGTPESKKIMRKIKIKKLLSNLQHRPELGQIERWMSMLHLKIPLQQRQTLAGKSRWREMKAKH